MKFATLDNGRPDGTLLLVSRDLRSVAPAQGARTLQEALERWDDLEPGLADQYRELNEGRCKQAEPLNPTALMAVLPRSYQFLDGSAFLAHNHILSEAWGFERRTETQPPLMYQGLSDHFYPASGSVPFRSIDDGIDFEAEYGVIVDRVPLGTAAAGALPQVKLIVLLNDWSLRAFGPGEMKGGFGFLHAKPPSSMSAIAITPDELGNAWRDGRVSLPLHVHLNGELFGRPDGSQMSYGFGDLIAHAATTRNLCAATVIGSGTVSNFDARSVGSACIAERQALERVATGKVLTAYLRSGDRVRIEALDSVGRSVFGSFEQKVEVLD